MGADRPPCEAACAVFPGYYNFCWRTHDVVNQRTRLPAAMEAGEVETLWSFETVRPGDERKVRRSGVGQRKFTLGKRFRAIWTPQRLVRQHVLNGIE